VKVEKDEFSVRGRFSSAKTGTGPLLKEEKRMLYRTGS
jgi:hypothetical protein